MVGLRCAQPTPMPTWHSLSGLKEAVSSTSEKTSFAPGNKAYRAAYDDAMAAARDVGCGVTN